MEGIRTIIGIVSFLVMARCCNSEQVNPAYGVIILDINTTSSTTSGDVGSSGTGVVSNPAYGGPPTLENGKMSKKSNDVALSNPAYGTVVTTEDGNSSPTSTYLHEDDVGETKTNEPVEFEDFVRLGDQMRNAGEEQARNRVYIPVQGQLRIPLPLDYSKHNLPSWDGNPNILVWVRLLIHEVVDVDIKDEIVKMDVDFDINWIDHRIANSITEDKALLWDLNERKIHFMWLNPEFLKHLWTPDISFQELAEVERSYFLREKVSVKLHVAGNYTIGHFQLLTRNTLSLRCEMDFRYYPADTQKCRFNLASYQYHLPTLQLTWKGGKFQPVYLQNVDDPNFDFQISNVEAGNNLRSYQLQYNWGAKHSTLTFTLQIRRNLSYHLVQTYLPSVLLVLITCLCFLLPPEMVEARIGVSMTTLLTLTAMFSSIRETSPVVSYTLAIDIWMVFCIFLVFLALVLFAIVYRLRRSIFQQLPVGDPSAGRMTRSGWSEGVEETKKVGCFHRRVVESGRYAFALLAILFLLFLSTYVAWLAIYSEYFTWDPSSLFNAGEEDGQYKYTDEPKQN